MPKVKEIRLCTSLGGLRNCCKALMPLPQIPLSAGPFSFTVTPLGMPERKISTSAKNKNPYKRYIETWSFNDSDVALVPGVVLFFFAGSVLQTIETNCDSSAFHVFDTVSQ